MILVSVTLLFISGAGTASFVHVEAAGVSFLTAWTNHASSLTTIGASLTVTVNLVTGTQIIVFAHVCWNTGAAIGNLSVTDSVNTPYTLKSRDSWSTIPCQMVSFVNLNPKPATQILLAWNNPVGSSPHYAAMDVLAYSGAASIGMVNKTNSGGGFGYGNALQSQVGILTQSVNSWLVGHTLGQGCGPAGGNYPFVFISGFATPGKRVQFNSDSVGYNECFTTSDTNGTVTSSGSFVQMGWNLFAYPATEQSVVMELDPPVVNPPTQWNPPVPGSSSPGFFDWLPPLVFLAGFFVMTSTVIVAGFRWFREH